MACVLNIGCYYFFFESAATAAKVADALNKAIQVDHDYKGDKGREYRHLTETDRRADIEIKMTEQSKPLSAVKALPRHALPNNEFFQIEKKGGGSC
jgi:hypothetical protein